MWKIINAIEKWIDENYLQEISLALRGLGKYRLARSFENLFVDATTWLRISPENREVKIKHFQTYNPKPSTSYKKPSNAGKKGNSTEKRRVDQREPELFVQRIEAAQIPPLKVKKTQSSWEVIAI